MPAPGQQPAAEPRPRPTAVRDAVSHRQRQMCASCSEYGPQADASAAGTAAGWPWQLRRCSERCNRPAANTLAASCFTSGLWWTISGAGYCTPSLILASLAGPAQQLLLVGCEVPLGPSGRSDNSTSSFAHLSYPKCEGSAGTLWWPPQGRQRPQSQTPAACRCACRSQ